MVEPTITTFTGAALKVGGKLTGAAARHARVFWARNNEGHRLTKRLAARVLADAAVHHTVRNSLAEELPRMIATDPQAQGALALLLDGEETEAAQAALAQIIARLFGDAVTWPEGFTAEDFGVIVAGYAPDAVNAAKATDREAAHTDAKGINRQIERLRSDVVSLRDGLTQPSRAGLGLPLTPPFSRDAGPATVVAGASLLNVLRASEQRFPLKGRAAIMDRAAAWLREPADGGPAAADHRVLVIHGPGGAGKTRLAAEILDRAEHDGWVAGFLGDVRPGTTDWPHLAHPQQPTAICVDYAEARRYDLRELFAEAPVGHEGEAPLRLILTVREGKADSESWLSRLAGPWDLGPRAEALLADGVAEVISLEDSLPELQDRRELWAAAHALLVQEMEPPAYLAEAVFERPLYVLLDASRQLPDNDGDNDEEDDDEEDGGGGDAGPASAAPTVDELLDGVLRHERNYWTTALHELDLTLDERRMNEVAIVSTLVGGVQRPAFQQALTSLPWLAADEELRRRVADWWSSIYATSTGAIRGIQPDKVGEYEVTRAFGEPSTARDQLGGLMSAERLAALIAATTLSGRQRILQVLTRIAAAEDSSPGAPAARIALTEALSRHLDEFLPETLDAHRQVADENGLAGEPLAMTVASAVVAADALQLVTPQTVELGTEHMLDGGDSARDVALQIVRRQVERLASREFGARRWSTAQFLDVMTWAVELDLRSNRTDLAATAIEEVAALQPRPHAPLVQLYMRIGRHLEDQHRFDDAEARYEQAMAELQALDGPYQQLAFVIWHFLGSAAFGARRGAVAVERLERALEGKTRHQGATDPDTITTRLALIRAQALLDLDEALAQLADAEQELTGVPLEERRRIQRYRPTLIFTAAREAEEDKRWEQAEALYQQTLTALTELGEQEGSLAYTVWYDLGEVAAAQHHHAAALSRFADAYDGKRRLDPLDQSTTRALVRLAKETARTDVDAALALLAQASQELGEHDDPAADALLQISLAEIQILTSGRRFDEAGAAARRRQDEDLARDVRRALLEAVTDPWADATMPTSVAAEATLCAAGILPIGDLRLPALASRLAELMERTHAAVLDSQLSAATQNEMAEQGLAHPSSERRRDRPLTRDERLAWVVRLHEEVPELVALGLDAVRRVAEVVERAFDEPLRASLGLTGDRSGLHAVPDDPAVRRWLTSTAVAYGEGEGEGEGEGAALRAAGTLLNLYMGLRLDVLQKPPLRDHLLAIWETEPDEELVAREQARLAADLHAAGGLELPAAEALVAEAKAMVVIEAATYAMDAKRWETADDLFRRGLTELTTIGRQDGPIAAELWYRFGELAGRDGQHDVAVERLEHSEAAMTRIYGAASEDRVGVVLRLALELATSDVDAALDRLAQMRDELGEAEQHRVLRERLDYTEIAILKQDERFAEATVVSQRVQAARAKAEVRKVIADSAADPVAEATTTTEAAIDGVLLAAFVVPAGDLRLPALASRLADVIAETTGNVLIARVPESTLATLTPTNPLLNPPVAPYRSSPVLPMGLEREVRAAQLREEVPDFYGDAREGFGRVLAAVQELRDNPAPSPAERSPLGVSSSLADDPLLRQWLTRTVIAGSHDEHSARASAAALLSFYIGLRVGALGSLPLRAALPAIWSSPSARDLVTEEQKRIAAELAATGAVDEITGKLIVLVAYIIALSDAAQQAERDESWKTAEDLYQLALTLLADDPSVTRWSIVRALGDVAVAQGQADVAAERFEEARQIAAHFGVEEDETPA